MVLRWASYLQIVGEYEVIWGKYFEGYRLQSVTSYVVTNYPIGILTENQDLSIKICVWKFGRLT